MRRRRTVEMGVREGTAIRRVVATLVLALEEMPGTATAVTIRRTETMATKPTQTTNGAPSRP